MCLLDEITAYYYLSTALQSKSLIQPREFQSMLKASKELMAKVISNSGIFFTVKNVSHFCLDSSPFFPPLFLSVVSFFLKRKWRRSLLLFFIFLFLSVLFFFSAEYSIWQSSDLFCFLSFFSFFFSFLLCFSFNFFGVLI